MDLKKKAYKFLVYLFLFAFCVVTLTFITISGRFTTWLWVGGGIALIHTFLREILKFLTIKKTFVTVFFASAILVAIFAFIFDLIVPGFDVGPGNFGPFNFEIFTLNGFPLDKTLAKIMFGAVFGLFAALLETLGSGQEKEA